MPSSSPQRRTQRTLHELSDHRTGAGWRPRHSHPQPRRQDECAVGPAPRRFPRRDGCVRARRSRARHDRHRPRQGLQRRLRHRAKGEAEVFRAGLARSRQGRQRDLAARVALASPRGGGGERLLPRRRLRPRHDVRLHGGGGHRTVRRAGDRVLLGAAVPHHALGDRHEAHQGASAHGRAHFGHGGAPHRSR